MPLGEICTYGEGKDLCIISYANGLWMSLRVAKRLEAKGFKCRVIDIRWLQPLPIEQIVDGIAGCSRILIVDECRQNSGIANELSASLWERLERTKITRVQAANSYIPLGAAANLVLVQEEDIERAALTLLETS